ncbi:hypothetical protein N7532_008719 [Penicillium argentinense]|uniref:Uncharacterized protein n=1 Tax=Penicillium argentinense TaxID=1131581 RepID=A0A9W9EYA0_9EURO|nr:uncharacterized protein N7532_008719 [Penicillium argentinense]KAJ5090035.1 hypothetical protein N7532_008719 [Penicillium argentinense]
MHLSGFKLTDALRCCTLDAESVDDTLEPELSYPGSDNMPDDKPLNIKQPPDWPASPEANLSPVQSSQTSGQKRKA